MGSPSSQTLSPGRRRAFAVFLKTFDWICRNKKGVLERTPSIYFRHPNYGTLT